MVFNNHVVGYLCLYGSGCVCVCPGMMNTLNVLDWVCQTCVLCVCVCEPVVANKKQLQMCLLYSEHVYNNF